VAAIVWHYLRDPTFSRFHTIPECDRHTHRQTARQTRRRHIPRLARRRAVKTGVILETLLDRGIVTTVHKQEVICGLFNGSSCDDLRCTSFIDCSLFKWDFFRCRISILISVSRCPSSIAELLVLAVFCVRNGMWHVKTAYSEFHEGSAYY